MATNTLPINNVVTISIATPPAGLADYKVSNLLYVTKEAPVNMALGDFTVYREPDSVGADWGLASEAYSAALNVFSQEPNILTGDGSFIVAGMAGGDTLTTIFNKIKPQIFFGGMVFGGYQPNAAECTAFAAVTQAAGLLGFLPTNDTAAAAPGGFGYLIQAAKQTFARALLYTVDAVSARLFAAAYAGRFMSTDWSGSLTAETVQMKDLVNVLPDPGINQTLADTLQTVGMDFYANIGPLPKAFSTGGNTYFDQIWGLLWLKFALQVAGFNVIAQTPTKIPQTESGIATLRNGYIAVLEQGVTNGFIAPGAWLEAAPFGDPTTLRNAVAQLGYYVYSQPVAKQSLTARAARKAPLIQIAVKLAGAVHTSQVIVNFEP